jgi:nucleoside-diphosphate-sugar epimerase
MKILLTGGSGFLGSALARHFATAGHELALLLRPGSSMQRLAGLESRLHIGRAASDAEIADFVAAARPEAVIHTACAYGRAGEGAAQIADANLRFGLVLLESLQAIDRPVDFLNTGSALEGAVSAYALAKQQFVQWGELFAARPAGALRFINLKLQHMYGPGDDRSKFTTHVLHACRSNQPRLALTAGEQARDFIHIDDVVRAYDTVLANADRFAAFDQIDVGSGTAPRIREFVETAHHLTGSRTALEFGALPYRPNEAMHCQADTTRLRALGWPAPLGLAAGLQLTLAQEFPS